MKEILFSLLFPIVSAIKIIMYHNDSVNLLIEEIKNKSLDLKEDLIDDKKKNIDILTDKKYIQLELIILYIIIVIIQLVLLSFNNILSFIIIIILWTFYMIIYDIYIKDENKIIFNPSIESIYEKNIKSRLNVDSIQLFKIIYFAVVIMILINKNNRVYNILLLIFLGILFQLINSTTLYINARINNKKINIIPSVFIYLNELIENNSEKYNRSNVNRIFGYSKLIILIIISIISGFILSKDKNNSIKLLYIFLIFTSIIFLWIFIIGDRSILERTYKLYNNKNYIHDNDILKHHIPYLISSQGGIFINMIFIFSAMLINKFQFSSKKAEN